MQDVVVIGVTALTERVQRTLQRRDACDIPLGETRCETREEQVGRSWRLLPGGCTLRRGGDLVRADLVHSAGEERCSERLQVAVSCRSPIVWLELFGRVEQQRRRGGAAAACKYD